MASVTIHIDGKDHSVELESVTPRESRAIKATLGLKWGAMLQSFSGAMEDLDGDAIVAAIWLAEKRSGVQNPQFRDDIPVLDLFKMVTKVDLGGAAAEDEAPKADSVTTE